jgi:hypothetical protein
MVTVASAGWLRHSYPHAFFERVHHERAYSPH